VAIPDLYNADKLIASWPGWSAPEPETGYIWFDAPLEIGGVVEAGFTLHGGAYSTHPDRHITFELKIGRPGIRRKIPIARIDWKSLSGGHSNKRGPPLPWAGKRVGECHVHSFELNWLETEGRMRTDLSQAEPMPQEIQSFESVRAYAGNLFRINNIDLVAQPPWEYRLF
jgi:hypothetical protein